MKKDIFNKATKFLTKALELYWKKKDSNVIFHGQFEHIYDTGEYFPNYYIDKYNDVFNDIQYKISCNDTPNCNRAGQAPGQPRPVRRVRDGCDC